MNVRTWLPLLAALPVLAQVPAPPPARPASRPSAPGRGAAAPTHRDLKFAPLRQVELPQPVRFQLSNGMKVLALEDHETPLVTVVAMVRTGSAFDPPNLTGLAAVTGALLRAGGTARNTPDALETELDSAGAVVDASVSETLGAVTLTVLRENLARALPLYRDILTAPDFRHEKLNLIRGNLTQTVRRRNDDPREVLRREFRSAVAGRDSAYTRRVEYATIGRISRADVAAFYRRYFFPANILLTVSGDFDAAEIKGVLEVLFGGWKEQQQPAPAFPKAAAAAAAGAHLAVRPGTRDTFFAVGQSGAEFTDPDAAALEVAAAVLGVGPQSRLVKRARESRGGVREIRADWNPGFEQPGLFMIAGAGQSSEAPDSAKMIFEEVEKLRTAACSEEEVRVARDLALMKTIAGLDNRPRALAVLARLEYAGYPADSLQVFQKALAAVTPADVLRVAKARLDPAKFAVVAVSNLTAFGKPLDPRGGATGNIDLTIPPPAGDASNVTAEATEAAKKLLQRAQQAVGGVEKLLAIKDFTQVAAYTGTDGVRETQTDRWLAPSHLRQDMQSSRVGTLVRYTDGGGGWISNGRNSTALTGSSLLQAKEEILRVYIQALLSDRLPGRAITGLDEETVEIAQGDARLQLVVSPETGLPAKLLYDIRLDGQPPIFVEEEYSDFREVAGVKVPFGIAVRRNGTKHSDAIVSEYKVNQGHKVEVLQRRP